MKSIHRSFCYTPFTLKPLPNFLVPGIVIYRNEMQTGAVGKSISCFCFFGKRSFPLDLINRFTVISRLKRFTSLMIQLATRQR